MQAQKRLGGIVLTQSEAGGGRWVVSTALWPLYPREMRILIVQEAQWASESVLTARKSPPPAGFIPRTVQLVEGRCTDYTKPTVVCIHIIRCSFKMIP